MINSKIIHMNDKIIYFFFAYFALSLLWDNQDSCLGCI